ncbi:hypothetical protein FEM48_Zijuj10G0018800 [Ziziphus jujuba var. spinosa]|uniref:DC1 domain-containing protein n=1 Tax=Ziziphus jujuba var. spinosa TaxID=714518 RepID=A0A978UKL3_ZIZJJ|nr:uncharacterized protein LOC107435452 [Ziziphus jujuba var. spinosa]KAH7515365.1 hypothetical protein FEM48_Zijuj10G0018800 [Ziziphus jujuba var. spinosa]
MDHLMGLVHPEEEHYLYFQEGNQTIYKEGSLVPLSGTCQKCKQPVSRDCYVCISNGTGRCEYYIHKECVELKDLPQEHHPLHPQHPLAIHSNYPHFKSFECSFCGEMKLSKYFCRCSEEHCDFYLDTTCVKEFTEKPELLGKYEIEHFLYDHENHRLSPYIVCRLFGGMLLYEVVDPLIEKSRRAGRGFEIDLQVPKDVPQHHSHPQRVLVLLQDQPAPTASDDQSKQQRQQLRYIVCLKWMEDGFYVHCTHCPTFNLDLQCYFLSQTKPTFKHDAHEHPLLYFLYIYDNDVRCYTCNTSCKRDSFRCFTCNFNIHPHCLALPNTVDYDDHVHPLTLTTSFKEDEHPTAYYCDICEKKRDPDRGIYLCEECPFIAHFECALSLSNIELEAEAYAPWRQKIEEDNHTSDKEEDMTLINEKVSLEIFDQLNVEIEELGQVIQQIIIKKREGEHLKEMLQEFDKRHTNTEDMLSRLKQCVRGTKSN